MKKHELLIRTAVTVLFASFGLQARSAQELFKAAFSAICVSTNQGGGLVYRSISNRNLIRDCAAEQGLTNLAGLRLVFNLSNNALEIVRGTNQTLVCTPLTFEDTVSLANTNKTKVELLASVFVETNNVASGTLAATERFVYGSSNQLTGFRLTGRIQYSVAASGTNSAKIYRGVLAAGSVFDEDDHEDHDD
jgi:hypothetical protein